MQPVPSKRDQVPGQTPLRGPWAPTGAVGPHRGVGPPAEGVPAADRHPDWTRRTPLHTSDTAGGPPNDLHPAPELEPHRS